MWLVETSTNQYKTVIKSFIQPAPGRIRTNTTSVGITTGRISITTSPANFEGNYNKIIPRFFWQLAY